MVVMKGYNKWGRQGDQLSPRASGVHTLIGGFSKAYAAAAPSRIDATTAHEQNSGTHATLRARHLQRHALVTPAVIRPAGSVSLSIACLAIHPANA